MMGKHDLRWPILFSDKSWHEYAISSIFPFKVNPTDKED